MSDKRTACRVRRRLPLVFSYGKQQHRGQTANLSRTGVCIHSDYVVTPGTELTVTLGLPGLSDVRVQAVVEWARKLRGGEILQAAHSMGVRFLASPGPEYHDFMSVIEGLAQPHGLTTRASSAADPPPAAPHREPPAMAPTAPRHAPRPARDPRREPEAVAPAAARHTPRHVRDPRREPESVAPSRPQREVVVVSPPLVEVQHQRQEPAPTQARLEKNLDFVVGVDDLAAPGEYPCSLSTARVAWLLEQGAAELAAPRLRGKTATVGLNLEVSVPHEPLAVGTPLSVVVRLTGTGADRRTYVFDVEITAGDRLVASGRHVRKLVEATSA